MKPVPNTIVAGIICMLAAVGCFALMHAAMKTLAPHYSSLQLASLRGWVSLPIVAAWILLRSSSRELLHVRWGLQLLRGAFAILTIAMAIQALRVLPLADAYTISFAAPLIVTLLCAPILGERVTRSQWVALLTGFSGVLLVLRPRGDSLLTLGGLAMLLSALGYAFQVLVVRNLTRSDSTIATVFWMTVIVTIGATALAWPKWTALNFAHGPALGIVAVTGVLGQYAVTEALRRAPASIVVPFEYTALAWALGLDWLLWQKAPDGVVLCGAALIIGSGLYLLQRQRNLGR